jgi:hypothetical protein
MHIGSTPDVPTTGCWLPNLTLNAAENQRFLARSDPSMRFGRAPQLHQVDLTECAW